jgi:hypothetical protein
MIRPRRDLFTLLGFHRVLIVTAVLACFGYGVRAILRADNGSSPWEAVVAWGLAGALLVYFWNIRHKR